MTRRRDYISSLLILIVILGISFIQDSYGATVNRTQLERFLPAINANSENQLEVWQTVSVRIERRKNAEVIYFSEDNNPLTQFYIDRASSVMTILGVGRAPLVELRENELRWSMKEEQYLKSLGLVFRKAEVVLQRSKNTCSIKYDLQKSAGINSIINLRGELRLPCLKTAVSH